jgi:hypothetical protein
MIIFVMYLHKIYPYLELMVMKEVDFKEQIIVQETTEIIQDVVIQEDVIQDVVIQEVVIQDVVVQDVVIQDVVIQIEVELALIHIYKKKLFIIL